MKCKILHESAGRIRVHLNCRHMTLHQADVLEYYLRNVDGVREVSVFDRTQDAVIVYRADRAALVDLQALGASAGKLRRRDRQQLLRHERRVEAPRLRHA